MQLFGTTQFYHLGLHQLQFISINRTLPIHDEKQRIMEEAPGQETIVTPDILPHSYLFIVHHPVIKCDLDESLNYAKSLCNGFNIIQTKEML